MKIIRSFSTYLAILIAVLILHTGCSKNPVTGKSNLNFYSLQTDVQLGAHVLESQKQAFNQKKIPIDSAKNRAMLSRVQNIVTRITKVSHLPNLPYEVHLADAPVVNAWAAPGGKIMVYEGLWDAQKGLIQKSSDNELAAVLAHEIAHCTARHVTRALSRNTTLALVGTAVSAVMSGAGFTTGSDLFGMLYGEGMNVLVPAYSRKSEAEADKIGLMYMAKAGYDPRAAIDVWKRASSKRGDRTSIYASHPASGERAQKLEQYLPEALAIYENVKRGKK